MLTATAVVEFESHRLAQQRGIETCPLLNVTHATVVRQMRYHSQSVVYLLVEGCNSTGHLQEFSDFSRQKFLTV